MITQALKFTDREAPDYIDKFFAIRQLVEEWNKNMKENFAASWMSCLDESMMIWYNKYAPGWMVVPRKPHPFGNEWHTICCCLSSIMFQMELVEGKDHPRQLGNPEHENDLGKTGSLMVRMTSHLHGTGKAVVMDSGFSVLAGLLGMKDRGVFGSCLIKKKRYWPKHCPGDAIAAHFTDKNIGDTDAIHGTCKSKTYTIACMKEPDYIMSLFCTHGDLNRRLDETNRTYKDSDGINKMITFKYPEPIMIHYNYRHNVDDHNCRCHKTISLEETWVTKDWVTRVFAFILSVTEVNVGYAASYFQNKPIAPSLKTRKSLAFLMITNTLDGYHQKGDRLTPTRKRKWENLDHRLESFPNYCGKWMGTSWRKVKHPYQQQMCSICHKTTRTYCSCNKSNAMCVGCFSLHVNDNKK